MEPLRGSGFMLMFITSIDEIAPDFKNCDKSLYIEGRGSIYTNQSKINSFLFIHFNLSSRYAVTPLRRKTFFSIFTAY
jgi:hypothetical protein